MVDYLEQHGCPCWIAPRDIDTGLDYADVINNAIERCSAFVLVFSDASEKSQFVKKELSTAVSFNKHIVPFRISRVELRGGFMFLLNNVQWIDAVMATESKFGLIVDAVERQAEDMRVLPVKPKAFGKGWWIAIGLAAVLALGGILWLALPKGGGELDENDTVPVVESTIVVKQEAAEDNIVVNEEKPQRPSKPIEPEGVKTKPVFIEKTEAAHEDGNVATDADDQVAQFNAKMKRANKYFNAGKYKPALEIYEGLKLEDPNNAEVDALIKECRKYLNNIN